MTEAVGAERHERNGERKGYRSGYYLRGLVTRVGKLELRVPQDRQWRFSTELAVEVCGTFEALERALAWDTVLVMGTRDPDLPGFCRRLVSRLG